MTKLEAVNQLFMLCGQTTASQLETGRHGAAADAERYIDMETESVLREGWHFNTRRNVTLTPDGSDHILVPAGTLAIDTSGVSKDRDVTVTNDGGRLYDLDENTDEFDESLTVDYTITATWLSIPPHVQEYIVARAAGLFNLNPERNGVIRQRIHTAKTRARQFDVDSSDINLLNTAEALQVKGLVSRTATPR